MSRLEKRCLAASAGLHGTLVLLLFVAPLFWVAKSNEIVFPVIEILPEVITDGRTGGGGSPDVKKLVLPPPSPEARTELPVRPPLPKPQPVAPKAEVKPAAPEPEAIPRPRNKSAEPVLVEKKVKKSKPEDTDDAEESTAGKKKVQVELNRDKPTETSASDARAQARASAQAAQAKLSSRISQIVGQISRNASSGTSIEVPGPGGEAFADYGQVVRLVYKNAWVPPPDLADDMATVEATVVIRRDGTVDSFRVTKTSGHAALDSSVSRLVRVHSVSPFPDGVREEKRKFIIEFNLRSMRSL